MCSHNELEFRYMLFKKYIIGRLSWAIGKVEVYVIMSLHKSLYIGIRIPVVCLLKLDDDQAIN